MKTLIFIISTFLTITLTFFGCGNLIPYAMQPSYHEFKQMCELNKLPNNEEKYNKILAYFDLSLDSLDWEELNKKTIKLKETNGMYKKGIFEYRTETDWKQQNYRTEMVVRFFSNEPIINRYNIKAMEFIVVWQTGRYHLKHKSMASNEFEWKEDDLSCGETTGFNLQVEESK